MDQDLNQAVEQYLYYLWISCLHGPFGKTKYQGSFWHGPNVSVGVLDMTESTNQLIDRINVGLFLYSPL